MMDMEQWNNLTQDIIKKASDQAELTTLMSQATSEFGELFAAHATAVKSEEDLKAQNDKLREANMNLFLQLSEQTKQRTDPDSGRKEQEKDDLERAKSITFDDLFKEE